MQVSRRAFLASGALVSGAVAIEAALVLGGEATGGPEGFSVATGAADITPEVGYPMGGYGTIGPRVSEDVNRPLKARCTVLWDSTGPHIVATADVLAFGYGMHSAIRAGVRTLGIPDSQFVLTATHTHNGPVLTEKLDPYIAYGITHLDEVTAYSDRLVDTLITLVERTLSAERTSCTLDFHLLDEGFSVNRTIVPGVPGERQVPVLVARGASGEPRAVLFGYGCHPVAAGVQTAFDPDYPSAAIEAIESRFPGCSAQFLTGAAGDQNPRAAHSSFALSVEYGRGLGRTVANAIARRGKSVGGPISSALDWVELPLDIDPTAAELERMAESFRTRAHHSPPYNAWTVRHAEVSALAASKLRPEEVRRFLPLPLQVWRMRGLRMLFSGGELVSGYARSLRQAYGSENIWPSAYSNVVPAYIPTDEMLRYPVYESGYNEDFPAIAGGSMAVYDYLSHFRGKRNAFGPDGVEQVLLAKARSLLG